jgi:hypothetical protein
MSATVSHNKIQGRSVFDFKYSTLDSGFTGLSLDNYSASFYVRPRFKLSDSDFRRVYV